VISVFITVLFCVVFKILNEAGPEIFVQSHSLIVPSGSLDADPSNETLSVGKVITWSGPAMAVGGLFVVSVGELDVQFSHEYSFLQELNMKIPVKAIIVNVKKRFFITEKSCISVANRHPNHL
jgi:hypothetical protein